MRGQKSLKEHFKTFKCETQFPQSTQKRLQGAPGASLIKMALKGSQEALKRAPRGPRGGPQGAPLSGPQWPESFNSSGDNRDSKERSK